MKIEGETSRSLLGRKGLDVGRDCSLERRPAFASDTCDGLIKYKPPLLPDADIEDANLARVRMLCKRRNIGLQHAAN